MSTSNGQDHALTDNKTGAYQQLSQVPTLWEILDRLGRSNIDLQAWRLILEYPWYEKRPKFNNFMLYSYKVREQIEQIAKTVAGIWTINQTGIRSLKLPCPPISVQQEKLAAL